MSAIHIWLIVFVALWLTSTVLLVILYMDQEAVKKDNADLRAEVQQLISPQGRSLPQFTEAKSSPKTMVDLLEDARAKSAQLLSGNGEDNPATLETKLKTQLDAIRADRRIEDPEVLGAGSCLDALAAIYSQFQMKADALAEATKGVDELSEELNALRAAREQQQKSFEQKAEELSKQIAGIVQDQESYRKERDEQVDSFEKKINDINRQYFEDIQKQRTENVSLSGKYDELMTRYQALKDKLGQAQIRPVKLATARQGDGVVLAAKPGEDVVYINLGSKDGMTLGLEFAVYDSLKGIPESGKAKARIEVVSVHPSSSECRVVDLMGNAMVMAGDIIANPIYDKDRKLTFFVLGEFDLNGDSHYDRDGARTIEALIKNWGGKTTDDLTAQVDFVVLGGPPPHPQRSLDLDPEADTRYQRAQKALDEYNSELATTKVLAIPVLTQEVFLNFLGYEGSSPLPVSALAGL